MIEQLNIIVISIAVILCVLYTIQIASYCYGWVKSIPPVIDKVNNTVFVSIIVAARNEETTIGDCIAAIEKQNYPHQKFELIIVDDDSTDDTNNTILLYSKQHTNIKLITLRDGQGGKKNAIRTAIDASKGELIVTTDADCVMGVNWLSTIVNHYQQSDAKMIVAPVSFYNEKTVFEKMQSIEFMALIASACGSLYFNKAIMCNGANLMYTKQVFNEVKGFEGVDNIASGDDVLLLYKIKDLYPKGIHFLKHSDAIVYTKAISNIKDFIDQRKRWASKGFKALNKETKYTSIIVCFFNVTLVFLIAFMLFYSSNNDIRLAFFKICLIIIGIKVFIDFLLLFLAASFFKKRRLLLYFLPEQLIYTIYVVFIGLLGSSGKYKWKDRKVN